MDDSTDSLRSRWNDDVEVALAPSEAWHTIRLLLDEVDALNNALDEREMGDDL